MSSNSGPAKAVAIIQARMTSTRLPGKVMADLHGEPMLAHMLRRVRRAGKLDGICVATTVNREDDPVAALCQELDVQVFRGDERDVLSRYIGAADAANAQILIRLTADCPMSDPGLIDDAVEMFRSEGVDYLSNALLRTYPDGLDVEVFTLESLRLADREGTEPVHREHVTPYLHTGSQSDIPTGDFRIGHLLAPADFSHLRWTVDREEDLSRVRYMVAELPEDYSWMDALSLLTRRPELLLDTTGEPTRITLRLATSLDGDRLFDWVNRQDCLDNKLKTQGPVSRQEHDAWLDNRLASDDSIIWIVERDGAPVGQIRLEKRGRGLDVDIYLDISARGSGIAAVALETARTQAARLWPGIALVARIKLENMVSRRLFAKAGYCKVAIDQDHMIYSRDPAVMKRGRE